MANEIKHITINHFRNGLKESSLYPISSAEDIVNTSENSLLEDKATLKDVLDALGRGAFTDGSGGGGSTITADLASDTRNGLMSSTHFTKLEGIEEGAQKNTITGIRGESEDEFRSGDVIITRANIGLEKVNNTPDIEKDVNSAVKDSKSQEIVSTYIKKLEVTDSGLKIIRGNDEEETLELSGGKTYEVATAESDGLMSSTHFTKLEGIEEGAQKNTITGIKGSAEEDFRTGNVIISKENIGLDKVDNTPDNEKNVLSATKLTFQRTISVSGAISGSSTFDGSADANIQVESIDASKITGMLDLSVIPAAALERCVVVPDEDSRRKLTTDEVQKGDTVKVTETGMMYMVVDEEKLDTDEGYVVFSSGTASNVPWAGITGKPSTFPPEEHTHNYAGSSTPGGTANSALSAGVISEEKPDYACLWFHEISSQE